MDLRTLEELAPTVAARHGATAAAWISQASVERVRDRVGRRVRDVERVLARAYAVLLEAALGVTESLPQDALRALLLDEAVAGELLLAVAEPGGSAPDAAVLRAACAAADAPGVDGSQVAAAFRRRVAQGDVGQERSRALLTDEGWRAWREAGATGGRRASGHRGAADEPPPWRPRRRRGGGGLGLRHRGLAPELACRGPGGRYDATRRGAACCRVAEGARPRSLRHGSAGRLDAGRRCGVEGRRRRGRGGSRAATESRCAVRPTWT